MDTITDILARPDEAARQLSEMRAALEAVTARLAAKDAELSEFRLAVQRDILSRLDVTLPQLAAVTAERDAARAEVARLTAALEAADYKIAEIGDETYSVEHGQYILQPDEFDAIRAVLRGDTAPAGRE